MLALSLTAAHCSSDGEETVFRADLVAVERGPLSIHVTSSGSIRAASAVVIKNKVEGRTTILSLIEEGKIVEPNTVLMTLDSSELEDERLEEEIEVETSRASKINAEQRLEIARKQGQADIEAAAVQYRLALLDVERYAGISAEELEARDERFELDEVRDGSILAQLNEMAGKIAEGDESREKFRELLDQLDGSYKQEMLRALNQIILADAERLLAQERVDGSQTLFERNFMSASELESDRLVLQRRVLDLEVALEELALLARFTYKRTIEELASAVNQSRFELEKAEHEAKANVVDAQATLNATRERLLRDELHLREINEQIEACTVRSSRAGMVVYATSGQDRDDRQEPLAEGVEVREGQALFLLPTTDGLIADLKIHESMLEMVELNQLVRVTSDALPGRAYSGRITKIAVLPDAQSRWINPNRKVYNTEVEMIGDTGDLRTGMSCRSEIVVAELEDALSLPIQCVVREDEQPVVYRPDAAGELQSHPVEVGMHSSHRVQILSGLVAGDLISLTPPLREAQAPPVTVDPEALEEDAREGEGDRGRPGEGVGAATAVGS